MENLMLSCVVILMAVVAADAKVETLSREPYLGAIVVNADGGEVLFADNADAKGYPASVLKLMDLLIILEKIEEGKLRYEDQVRVTAESARTGGSQVYLKEHEVFSIEELLYALMIQSANDAAVALAIHIAGSKDGFVSMMNERARQIGMNSTRFASVHGLPPGSGQEPDVTTARDLALLCVELAKHPDAFKFTSVRERPFRHQAAQPFIMRTHNHLLGRVEGCDGFKTGYFTAAGFSIAATAKRGAQRIVCVILGSELREKRDARAAELIAKGFLILPAQPRSPPPPAAITNALPPPVPMPVETEVEEKGGSTWLPLLGGIVIGLAAAGAAALIIRRRNAAKGDFVRRS